MKLLLRMVAVLAALALIAVGVTLLANDRADEGVFHPDHTRVFNGFQGAASVRVGETSSSVDPVPECKQIDESQWRCYRRWAPVGRPADVEVLEAEVNVYDERVVVGPTSRVPD